MPATEIYLIRHGQTDYNRQFRLQGRSDIPLNRLGLAQARAAHEALRGVHFDAVYASPLRRAVDTACIVSGWPEEKIELDPRLIEIGFGIWEGSDFHTLGPAGTAFFETPQNYTPPQGGESLDSVLRRTGGFLDALQQLPEDRHVLVASHGAALNASPGQTRDFLSPLFWTHRFGNCSIVRPGLSGGRLSVLRNIRAGRPRLSPGTARREHAGRGNCTKARAMMPCVRKTSFFLFEIPQSPVKKHVFRQGFLFYTLFQNRRIPARRNEHGCAGKTDDPDGQRKI